jgi:hypothetical protein
MKAQPGETMQTFQVGSHAVSLTKSDRRWHVAVDETRLSTWFLTEAEAWASGVREAQRLDSQHPAAAGA